MNLLCNAMSIACVHSQQHKIDLKYSTKKLTAFQNARFPYVLQMIPTRTFKDT